MTPLDQPGDSVWRLEDGCHRQEGARRPMVHMLSRMPGAAVRLAPVEALALAAHAVPSAVPT
jgi:hypothetical protein